MYSFTLNKQAYQIPSLASELTLGQFMDIGALQPDDEIGLLSVLMGKTPELSVKDGKDADAIGKELKSIYALIDQFQAELSQCINSGILLLPPKRIEILGLNMEIKKGFVGTLPYWGYVHTRNIILKRMKEGKNEQFNATFDIAGILAHNLYTLVTRSAYNEQRAEEFIEVVKEANFIEAMQLGNFFLIQQKRLWTSRPKRWIMRLNLWRLRLVSKYSVNTDQSTRSKLSLEEIFSDGKK